MNNWEQNIVKPCCYPALQQVVHFFSNSRVSSPHVSYATASVTSVSSDASFGTLSERVLIPHGYLQPEVTLHFPVFKIPILKSEKKCVADVLVKTSS